MNQLKRTFFVFALVIFCAAPSAIAQDQGIGLRLGNPLGLSYKKYLNKRHGVELGIGSAGPGWHKAYYQNAFENDNEFEDLDYKSHQVKSVVYFQARYLIHEPIYVQDLEGKWNWYWGVGGVLKVASVKYHYTEFNSSSTVSEIQNDFDFGPEGIIGMEYTFQDVPVSVFGDVSLMLEILDRFTLQPFGGVGVRYNF